MFDAQLEMSFGNTAVSFTGRQRRLTRAQWWFHRMRQVVDRAIDWKPAPPARPEQMWLIQRRGQSQVFAPFSR